MRVLIILFISLIFVNASDTKKSNTLKKSGHYVIDKANKLMWQDNKITTKTILSQEKAVSYCKKLRLGGFKNWKTPSVEEYKTIIDKTRDDEIMIDKTFKYILQEGYWTRDRTWRNFGIWGYYIYFKSGAAYYENRTYPKYVRCVREMK